VFVLGVVDVAAVRHAEHDDDHHAVIDLVGHPVVTDSDPPGVLGADELLHFVYTK